jgi:uncharacterized membrane protein
MMTSQRRGDVRWEWIGDAWQFFTENPGAWIGMTIVSAVVAVIAIVLPVFFFIIPTGILASGSGGAGPSAAGIAALAGSAMIAIFAIAVISLLISSYLMAGLFRAAIQQAKGEAISVGDLFSAGDSFSGVLGLMFLYFIAGVVLALLAFPLAFVSEELSVLFSLAVRLLQLVAWGFLFFTIPLIVDRKLGVMDAIRTSISTTTPQWWMYVLFVLVLTIIYVLGVIPCGLGLLVTIPLVFLASAAAYRDTFLRQGAPGSEAYSSEPPPPSYYAPQPQFSNPPQANFPARPPQPQFSNPPEAVPPHAQDTQFIGKACPTCGAAITRVANFCNQCGSSLPA